MKIQVRHLFDGRQHRRDHLATIAVEDRKIVAVNDGADSAMADLRLDDPELTVLPGLIDAHAHLALVNYGQPPMPAAIVAAQIFRNCAQALDEGFTLVRDLGGADGALADAIASGLVRGPRMLPSGPILCQTGSHGDFSPCFGVSTYLSMPGLMEPSTCIDGADAARHAARLAFKRGATQLKVILNGGFSGNTPLKRNYLSHEELVPLVEEAERNESYVTAHIHSLEALQYAISAGVKCVEHGTFLGQQGAEQMAEAAMMLVPTLSILARMDEAKMRELGISRESAARAQGALEANLESMKAARDCGVQLGLGSDIVGVNQRRRADEILYRAEVENPFDALVAATSGNAAVLRRQEEIGSIAPQYDADIIAVRGDPFENPALLLEEANIVLVMKEGKVVKNLLRDQQRA